MSDTLSDPLCPIGTKGDGGLVTDHVVGGPESSVGVTALEDVRDRSTSSSGRWFGRDSFPKDK